MFSTVKIENGVILDGKKLKCVKSYKLEQKERDDIAELTVNMDVRFFVRTISRPISKLELLRQTSHLH